MPVLFIEAPPGIRPEKKRAMMQKITEAVDEAYHIWPVSHKSRPRGIANIGHASNRAGSTKEEI